MRKYTTLLFFITIALFFSAYSEKTQQKLPVVDLKNVKEKVDLNFTDMAENIQILPLPLGKEHPIDEGASFLITDRWILCGNGNELLQFTRHGEFVRVLATKGRGPEELIRTDVRPGLIDEKGEMIFFRNPNGSIKRINLVGGDFLEPIRYAVDGPVIWFSYFGNGIFYILPHFDFSSAYLYYFQDSDGNFISGQKRVDDELKYNVTSVAYPWPLGEMILYFNHGYTKDTVYQLSPNKCIPAFRLFAGDIMEYGEKPGSGVVFRGYTKHYYLVTNWVSNEKTRIREIEIEETHTLFLIPESLKVVEINSLVNDIIGAVYDESGNTPDLYEDLQMNYLENEVFFAVDAFTFRQSVEENPDRIHPDYKDRVMEVYESLHEEDNPVLIIGTPKPLNLK